MSAAPPISANDNADPFADPTSAYLRLLHTRAALLRRPPAGTSASEVRRVLARIDRALAGLQPHL